MVGGGIRKDEGVVINSSNVFAALGSLKKKKKKGSSSSDKDVLKTKSSVNKQSGEEKIDPQVFWAPAPLNTKSWADVDDEDDDDYFATTALPRAVWDADDDDIDSKAKESITLVEESESEEGDLDEVDDEEEDEHDRDAEPEDEPEPVTPVAKKTAEVVAPKESERQLSKKELKKKELEELDAMLAEFGLNTEGQGGSQEKNTETPNGEVNKKENGAAGESKSAKKKKKKDKSIKEQQERPNGNEVSNGTDETIHSEKVEEAPAVDVKEKLKKVASAKKKKSSKEMDAAAKVAAGEAAARNARLAASKKKDKNHYNQQPTR